MPPPLSLRFLLVIAVVVPLAAISLVWLHPGVTQAAPVTVQVSSAVPAFTPRVTLAEPGQSIQFSNSLAQPLQITSASHDPAQFSLTVPSNGAATLTLTTPGLYHYFDGSTAHVVDFQADNDVVDSLPGAPSQDLPLQGWIYVPGNAGVPYDSAIHVPALHDLMSPHAAVVHVGGSVLLHNGDTDAHNMVTDPNDPTGAAFELLGTDGEPAIGGAVRQVTFTATGLYHIYCSIHTRVVGQVGGWNVVVPRDNVASGYADRDPMEAWILVVP
ncbi:MAG TPA: hypothetical protein VNL71_04000 [Chloroflexota bacterium]|nr:hypothetical protein [Chloroflexota bacterium]